MTFTRLPGLKFTETVTSSIINEGLGNVPLFIVQTSTAIDDIDNTITYFTGIDAFNTLIEGKGLTYTQKVIEQNIEEYGYTSFYIYSIKTDTQSAFTNLIKSTANLLDIRRVIFIEETKSTQANNINKKIKAILTGLQDNAENGIFRTALIIPYGTLSDAVTNKASGTSNEEAAIVNMGTILDGVSNGRIEVAFPDENAGYIVGRCMATEYNDDPGRLPFTRNLEESTYNFDANQMLQLLNLGVLFIWKERYYGSFENKICYGVTTAAATNKKDDLIVCRKTVDELLTQIGFEATALTKERETESNEVMLQSIVDDIVNSFVTSEDIYRDDTSLTVSGDGRVFKLTGQIRPVRSAYAIEVNTTIV